MNRLIDRYAVVFVAIVVRVFLPSRKRELDEAKRLPLDDEPRRKHNGGVS